MDNQQLSTNNYTVVKNARGTTNKVILKEKIVEVIIVKGSQEFTMIIDSEDYLDIGVVRMSSNGYAYKAIKGNYAVHHIVMNHESNRSIVIDHINGNKLDNRKQNLRIVSAEDNANNRTNARNNTGIVGISKRVHPIYNYVYYRATVSDRKTPMGGAKSKTKQISKNFNINKLGDVVALNLAIEWIDSKKKEFGYLDDNLYQFND